MRLYLRSIGRVPLLTAADERRLARQIEEATHLAGIEEAFADAHGRPPAAAPPGRSSKNSTTTCHRATTALAVTVILDNVPTLAFPKPERRF